MHIPHKKKLRITELNMTPMIDVVFLLITFFMVVTEITRQDDIEDLELPDIKASKPDDNPDPERLVLNILKNGTVYVGGAALSDRELEDILWREAKRTRDEHGISDRVVLVKADRRVEFKHIRKVIMFCVKKNIKIWRLAFGTLPSKSSDEVGAAPSP